MSENIKLTTYEKEYLKNTLTRLEKIRILLLKKDIITIEESVNIELLRDTIFLKTKQICGDIKWIQPHGKLNYFEQTQWIKLIEMGRLKDE